MSLCPSSVPCFNVSGYNPALAHQLQIAAGFVSAANWISLPVGDLAKPQSEVLRTKSRTRDLSWLMLTHQLVVPDHQTPQCSTPGLSQFLPLTSPLQAPNFTGPTLLVEGHFLLPSLPHPKQAQPCHMTLTAQSYVAQVFTVPSSMRQKL